MELNFQKSLCQYLKPVLHQVQNQELTQELRLSDGMPDIGRVLSGWGQVILRSKEWRGDCISFSGGLMVWVLYMPEDGTAPRTLESWIPFTMKWDIDDGHREGNIRIQCLVRFVDARGVSPRKIMVRAGVAALGEALQPAQQELGMPGEVPEDVQLLKNSYPLRLTREAGEKTFLMDEELTLPDTVPALEKLVYYTMNPRITEKRITGNKVVFRGEGNLHILYTSADGQLHSWDFELPFSQFSDLDGNYSPDAQGDIRMAVTSLELERDAQSRLRLKTGLLGQYLVDDRVMLELVEDAYSPNRSVELKLEMLELPALLDRKMQPLRPEEAIHQDANLVADVEYLPDFPRLRRTGDDVQAEIPGQFQMLYYDENGTLQSGAARWDGDLQMTADEESFVGVTVLPGERPEAMAGNGSISMTGSAILQMNTLSCQGIPMVMGLQLGEQTQPDPGRPSVILRRTGEAGLWDIAKSTGSTVDAIRRANNLEAEPATGQLLLIPIA